VASGVWKLDDEAERIHGHLPGAFEATTDSVLAAALPDDVEAVRELLMKMISTTEPFSVPYRLEGADGVQRNVVMVGERALCGDPNKVTVIEGFFIDLTSDIQVLNDEAAREAVQASAEHRAVIERAKGALMMAYGFDEDAAFSMLSWWSRNRNVKLRVLAAELMKATGDGATTAQELRGQMDGLLHDIANRSGGTPAKA
jgi:hypothetical protein